MSGIPDVSRGVEKIPVNIRDPTDLANVTDFVYTTCNVAGLDNHAALSDRFAACECNHDAEASTSKDTSACTSLCSCLQGFDIPYTKEGLLSVSGAHETHHAPLFECHRLCRCTKTCPTRVVQCGIQHRLEVFKTANKGFGLATLEPIKKNMFVCEYAGEVLTPGMARIRIRTQKADNTSNYYLFVLNEHLSSRSVDGATVNGDRKKTLQTYVDPTFIGNAARFINHSCDPNLYMVPVRIGCPVPSLALFAYRDIEEGEELTFNYAGVKDESCKGSEEDETDEELEARHRDKMARVCCCGSANCLGYLPFDESLFDA